MPESPNRGVLIVLAYLWVLALVPLLLERDDPEVQWHAKHGLALFACLMLMSIVSLATFGLGCVLGVFVVFGWMAILALHVAAILKGVNGGRLLVPYVSEYADRI